ncbi:unnamed protein product [Cuscuta epithymum]|uniref:SelT-like protein n=1 Tax=Cuscuta epithymum TaxID=186058 RepID=A0AAV0D1R2_9ASTE|nr:unnamed protein product [Cuscuta epithymum]
MMDRAQLLMVGLPLIIFCSDIFRLFSPPPPKPAVPHHSPPAPVIQQTHVLDFPAQTASGRTGAIGLGNTVSIDFCSSCSYRGTAVTMKNMLETQFPGIHVVLANYPAPLPKRLLSKLVPIVQFSVIGIIMVVIRFFQGLVLLCLPHGITTCVRTDLDLSLALGFLEIFLIQCCRVRVLLKCLAMVNWFSPS